MVLSLPSLKPRTVTLWIGTQNGLARFDGARFDVFDKAQGQLPGSSIYCFLQDSERTLWIGTNAGLVRYRAGKFQTLSTEADLSGVRIVALAQDSSGAIWIVAGERVFRYRNGSTELFQVPDDDGKTAKVLDVAVDRAEKVWVLLRGGTVCQLSTQHFEAVPELASLRGRDLYELAVDKEGALWISSFNNGAYRYKEGKLTKFGAEDGIPNSAQARPVRDQSGNVWLGTGAGLARITESNSLFFPSNGKEAPGDISVIYEDREGNLWVGSASDGLYRFSDASFTLFRTEEGLPEDMTAAVCEDFDHSLLVGGHQGFYRGRTRFEEIFKGVQELTGDQSVVELLPDPRDQSLWIGTSQGLIHNQARSFTRYGRKDGVPSDLIESLDLDHEGNLWVGSQFGLACLKDGRFFVPEACAVPIAGKNVVALVEDHEGGMWIGTTSGVFRYQKGQLKQFGPQDGLADSKCCSIFIDAEGIVWVSAMNGGLARFDGQHFFAYLQNDGLPSDFILSIIDNPTSGDLWLGTPKGVFRVSKKSLDDFRAGRLKHIYGTLFGKGDGLMTASINIGGTPNVFRGQDGRLWWTTDKGIAVVDPNHLTLHTTAGPVVIESVVADDRPLAVANPKLLPGTRRLKVGFTTLTFATPDKVRFRYRLDGVDLDWFDAGQRREAFFTNLGRGQYHFRVQASADGGATWTEPGAEISFSVQPHFYETWWFLTACGVAVAGLIWAAFILRQRQLEARFRAVLTERVRVAGEIHDSLAQGFASAAMLIDGLDREVAPDSALKSKHKAIRSILGSNLADARSMIATLRGQPIKGENLQLAFQNLVERLGAGSAAPISLEFSSEKIPAVSPTIQQELLRIAQEGVNNAIKHAKAKRIEFYLGIKDPSGLLLTVRDDGIGFDTGNVKGSGHETHFGLIGLSERAKRIRATLEIHSHPGTGTELEVIVPLFAKGAARAAV